MWLHSGPGDLGNENGIVPHLHRFWRKVACTRLQSRAPVKSS